MDILTYLPQIVGGVLIGLASALLLLGPGRIAGASGILAAMVVPWRAQTWQVAFVSGLLVTGVGAAVWWPSALVDTHAPSAWALVPAGLLVGFGTRVGNGCTSGHGVCGNARLSRRSLVATGTFIATGMLTVALVGVWA